MSAPIAGGADASFDAFGDPAADPAPFPQGMKAKETMGQCDTGGGLAMTEESSNAPRFTFT